jgi:branched-chain amino acid transport system permease protein
VDTLLQQLVNGLTLGAVYAVVALGYTMVYGIIQLINFAHGEVVMVGAMVACSMIGLLAAQGWSPWLVLLIATLAAVPACVLLGWLVERVAYRPLRDAPRLAPLITAIGVSIILQHLALLLWTRNPLAFPQLIPNISYALTATEGGASISAIQLAILSLSLLLMTGLLLLVHRTRLGVAMRATAQNPAVAGLMGVDTHRIIAITFMLGAALAAIAGVMVGSYYGVAHYGMGSLLGLKAFSAAVLGGIGNIPGAMLGGLLLGLIEALGAGYIGQLTDLCHWPWLSQSVALLQQRCADQGNFVLFGSDYQDVFAFMVLIAVLVLRPSGLLGERVGERA